LYECLAERGYEKVTVKEIARKANLAPGVIHYYFRSKDEIVASLANALVNKLGGMLVEKIEAASSVEEKITFAIDYIVETLIFNPPLNRVFYNLLQMAYEREELSTVVREMFSNYRTILVKIFKEANAGRESKMLGGALVAITEGFSVQLMVDPEAFKPEQVRLLITHAIKDRLADNDL
ncbi:MAG: TetR/AcrR family transcriptional regulator, partial [Dethiobacteria bacterium]|nr:TetR/AcrR family transcriptional regulator [Dethiobacteria bacterium]